MTSRNESTLGLRSGVAKAAPTRQLRQVCLVALGLLGVALACCARRIFLGQQNGRFTGQQRQDDTVALAASHFCNEYPHLKFKPDAVAYSNLAGKGPDHGRGTGIVYRTTLTGGGEKDREVLMVVNTTSAHSHYVPFLSKMNGMQGMFGSINLMSGNAVGLAFTFVDSATGEKLRLPRVTFTFFDLDTGLRGMSQESITLSDFTAYYTSLLTEVGVAHRAGETMFYATRYGNAEDNPKDPMALTALQQNRAVGVDYRDLETLRVTLAASRGKGPRFFTFVAFPSLKCAATVHHGGPAAPVEVRIVKHAMEVPLPNLRAKGPLEVGVKAADHGRFLHWKVKNGTKVSKGDDVLVSEESAGQKAKRVYRAPVDGTVVAMQDLKAGDDLGAKLKERTVLVIQRSSERSSQGSSTHTVTAPTARHSPTTTNLTTTALTTAAQTTAKPTTAPRTTSPPPTATHSSTTTVPDAAQHPATTTAVATTMVVTTTTTVDASIPPLGPITPKHCKAAIVRPGKDFVEYKVQVGTYVRAGQVIAVTKDKGTGGLEPVTSNVAGRVLAVVAGMKPGDPVSRVADRNLAVVEKQPLAPGEKFPALSLSGNREDPTEFPEASGPFVAYTVKVGDIVETGSVIATTRTTWGWVLLPVKSKRPGVVKCIQEGLEEGMNLTKVLPDKNLATLGPLPRLPVSPGDEAALVPADGGWVFYEWMAKVGDVVRSGHPIAQLRSMTDGSEHNVLAPRDGEVLARQEHLLAGDEVKRVLEFLDLLTIGKIKEPKLGRAETAVKAPYIHDIFNFFYVHDGDHVNKGEPFAQVMIPTRSLLEGERELGSIEGSAVTVTSPVTGIVSHLVPLKSGVSIFEQSSSTTIATIRTRLLWFYPLLGVLFVMTFCLLPGFRIAMQKPRPEYVPMAEEPVEKPDNIRLLFDNGEGSNMTVYARYRPLGMKHERTAPIQARGFETGAYARMGLGVQEGWTLVKVGDEDLSTNSNFDEAWQTLEGALAHLPLWPLEMEFQPPDKDAEPQVVTLRERPLGIELTERTYIHVDRVQVGSPAQEAGIEAEWIIRRIGDFIVHESCALSAVRAALEEGASRLVRRT